MNAIEIVTELQGRKGQHVQLTWVRPVDTLKSAAVSITKRTCAWVRTGINYANLASVKDGIEMGTRDEVQPLPYGQWRAGWVNYIIDHTPKGASANVEYVRMYPPVFDNLSHPTVEWTMDGVPTTYEAVEPYLKASEKRKERAKECFNVRAEYVVAIG